jgi:hypothetical protein
MKHAATIGIAVLALAGCEDKQPAKPSATPASPGATAAPVTNAAPKYEAVWAQIPEDLNTAAAMLSLTEDGRPEITPLDGSPEPDQDAAWERLVRLLERDRAVVDSLLRAAAQPRCDFGLKDATATGPDFQRALTIGGSFRKSARLLRADAVRAWLTGDADAAAARLEAMYRLGGHLAQQDLVLQSLVSNALIQLANSTAATMSTAGTPLPERARERVLAALNALDTTDPSGLARARQHEGEPDAQTAQQLDQSQARLVKDIARTRQALRGE